MSEVRYTIPGHVRDYIKSEGYACPYDEMSGAIDLWHRFLMAEGDFWDWSEVVNGASLKQHRMSIHPAERVSNEWASLLLNEETTIGTEDEGCNEWLQEFLDSIDFEMHGQESVMRAFALGTGAWDLSIDTDDGTLRMDTYDARGIIPLSWDNAGVAEVALCTKINWRGEMYDQLKMHVLDGGTYHIRSVFWDKDGNRAHIEDAIEDFDTEGILPWFAIVKPAVANTTADMSPYGQSVYASALDVLKSVDLCYDAIFNEVDLAKMRIFISSMLVGIEERPDGSGSRALPFGNDNTVFRKVDSIKDEMIDQFAPAMRTDAQVKAYRTAVQTMGDLCGFGPDYFDIDDHGGLRTATEVSSDNSAMMRNIKKHENVLRRSIVAICRAALHAARAHLNQSLGDEGVIDVHFDDSIITDTQADKKMMLDEIAVGVVPKWMYLVEFYGMTEEEAKAEIGQEVDDGGF